VIAGALWLPAYGCTDKTVIEVSVASVAIAPVTVTRCSHELVVITREVVH
jgi:hypothetical protein